MPFIDHGSDLFSYDQQTCSNQILFSGTSSSSKVEYDEYVVYHKDHEDEDGNETSSEYGRLSSDHIIHRFSHDDTAGADMLDLAFRHGFTLDRNGEFTVPEEGEDRSEGMHGRVRRVICFRRKAPFEGVPDLLSMTVEDMAALDIHPATLQYATRTGTESRFWSRDRSLLNIILAFPEVPKTPCDFISMSYDANKKSATILIRQSFEPRRHNLDDLDEYDHRLESCRDHWAHPLVMPVILLQVQFMRCEEAVTDNSLDVVALEEEVSELIGSDGSAEFKKLRRQLTGEREKGKDEPWGPMNMTARMKRAHEVLRGCIKLLDTIRWMERAVKLLILAGDELDERLGNSTPGTMGARDLNMGGDQFGIFDRAPSPSPFLNVPMPSSPRSRSVNFAVADELGVHWHEIRQYLEGLLRLSMSLETERRMSEARCRAQVDMIYSKMAQEDNALNARMAVASSRDSSSMKALAVITAIFLPGEFIGTLFGMSMFDFLVPGKDEEEAAPPGTEPEPDHVLSGYFWVYWAIAIPLTLFIIVLWRAWWVNQDRYFRRHLSKELSEERYWTSDGKPRHLEHSFLHDLFYLSARRDEKATPVEELESDHSTSGVNSNYKEWSDGPPPMATRISSIRQRQMLSARQQTLPKRTTTISI